MPVPLYQAKAEFLRMLGHPVCIRVHKLLQDGPKPVRPAGRAPGIAGRAGLTPAEGWVSRYS